MTARPRLTPIQDQAARAALDELRRLYVGRLDHMQTVLALLGAFDGYCVPVPASLPDAGSFCSLSALSAGMDELAGYIERAEIVQPDQPMRAAA